MPTIGLILEGKDDEAAIPVLVLRCRSGIKVITRQCRGTVKGKVVGLVAELNRSYPLERILVVCDADGEKPENVLAGIRKTGIEKNRFPVIPLVIVQMLEAWLLADPEALEKVIGFRKDFINPERERDPKTTLERLLRQTGRYTPAIAARIAQQIDLKVLRKRCPRFEIFRKAVGVNRRH
jgi:hypothetical protein